MYKIIYKQGNTCTKVMPCLLGFFFSILFNIGCFFLTLHVLIFLKRQHIKSIVLIGDRIGFTVHVPVFCLQCLNMQSSSFV